MKTLGAVVFGCLLVEFLAHLVATHTGEVVTLRIPEQGLNETTRRLHGCRLTGTQLAVEVEKRLVLVGSRVLFDRVPDRLGVTEHLEDFLVSLRDSEGLEKRRHVLAPFTVDADADGVLLVGVELQPCATAGNDLPRVDHLVRCLVLRGVEVDAGRPHEL